MHREGALTDAQAIALYQKSGLTPELAKAYLAAASTQRTAKTHELAQSTVEALYRDRLIPRTEAAAFLGRSTTRRPRPSTFSSWSTCRCRSTT